MAQAFLAIVELIPAYPSAARLVAAAGRATGNVLSRARRWRSHRDPVSVSDVSSEWLLEYEIASRKRQDDR